MQKFMLIVSALALMSSTAFADVIADRKGNMKERGGILAGLSKVVKGETAFDAGAVATALQSLQANAENTNVDAHYPDGTGSGDTKASPKIWEDKDGFKAASAKYLHDVTTAASAAPSDVEALKAQFGTIASNCGACHRAYRL